MRLVLDPRERPSRLRRVAAATLVAAALAVLWASPNALAGGGDKPASTSPEEVRRLLREGRAAEAEEAARALCAEAAGRHGRDSLEQAAALELLVKVLWETGKGHQDAALDAARESLRIKQGRLSPDDLSVALSLNQLGSLLDTRGDYTGALAAYRRALEIREKAYGSNDPRLAGTINNLAWTLKGGGDYAEAKRLFERARALIEGKRAPGEKKGRDAERARDAAVKAAVLNNLSQVLQAMGDLREARRLLEEALALWQAQDGPSSPAAAGALNNLGRLLHDLGDLPAARAAFDRALEIWEAARDPNPRELASALNNSGWLLLVLGERGLARTRLERALELREKNLGNHHADTVWTIRNLAVLESEDGRREQALETIERAILGRRAALGAEHPLVADDLSWKARLLAAAGDPRRALESALEADGIARESLRLNLRTAPERLGLGFAALRGEALDQALSLAARGLPPAGRRAVWDSLVRSRAIVLDEVARRHRASEASSDAEGLRLSRELAAARARFAHLLLRGPGDGPTAGHHELLDQARRAKEKAEEALAERSPPYRREEALLRAGLGEVLAALPPDSALASFAVVREPAPAGVSAVRPPQRYLAFVAASGRAEPDVVSLGSAAEIDELAARFLAAASTPPWAPGEAGGAAGSAAEAEASCRRAGEALRERVWDPIAGSLAGAARVFIVGDGSLHLLNFAALPVPGGKHLVESGPLLHHLSAERDLLPREGRRGDGLLILGGAEFDEASLFSALSKKKAPTPIDVASTGARPQARAAAPFRGTRPAWLDLRSARFEPLPASAREAEEIAALWKTASRSSASERVLVLHLEGARATEAAIKASAPGKRVLHLATHGFFLEEGGQAGVTGARGFGRLSGAAGEPAAKVGLPSEKHREKHREQRRERPDEAEAAGELARENPLVLSGLALAGANHRAAAGPEEDDGILTAEEIASLDLSGVEWAVLSACDTGRGQVRAGEGVLGLRRAFQIAGARTLVLSLWPVDDAAARKWMVSLYRARLMEGRSTAEAVRAAALEVLSERRRSGASAHPFAWGAFMATGDWR